MVFATDEQGTDITGTILSQWLRDHETMKLSQFFIDRLYGRYLKPLDYPSEEYRLKYKSGFAIMINCCLLIETYMSWMEPVFRQTDGKSERCFMYFFLTNSRFHCFSVGSPALADIRTLHKKLDKSALASDFWVNVRCALLHNGETNNGWRIVRSGPLFDAKSKRINAVVFMDHLKQVLKDFKINLDRSDFHNDLIWKTYKDRLSDLLQSS